MKGKYKKQESTALLCNKISSYNNINNNNFNSIEYNKMKSIKISNEKKNEWFFNHEKKTNPLGQTGDEVKITNRMMGQETHTHTHT